MGNPDKSRFIILIPHRDTQRLLDIYRGNLFAAGYYGARSFPASAPLAAVSGPFSQEELKALGRNMREALLRNTNGRGMIQCKGSTTTGFGGKFTFFGPLLSISMEEGLFPGSAQNKILQIMNPPVLCAALVEDPETAISRAPEAPDMSFRAAALANLTIRALPSGAQGYSWEWETSPLVWLPKHSGPGRKPGN